MFASFARAARRWDSHCRLSGTELKSCKAAAPYAALHPLRGDSPSPLRAPTGYFGVQAETMSRRCPNVCE